MDWSDYLYYDETSPSCLRWKVDRFTGPTYATKIVSAGQRAGTFDLSNGGYWRVVANKKTAKAHRVIWKMFVGDIPATHVIDHINGDSSDNRLDNLRCIPRAQNQRNQKKTSANTSGVTGISYMKMVNAHGNFTVNEYWKVEWMDITVGKKLAKNFSITRLGNEEAFRLACEYRKKMIEELNAQGAGYTERHGT